MSFTTKFTTSAFDIMFSSLKFVISLENSSTSAFLFQTTQLFCFPLGFVMRYSFLEDKG